MVLQILTSVIYEIVKQSWAIISIVAKYYILGLIIYLYSQNKLDLEQFQEKIISDSRLVVGLIVIVGSLLYISGVSISPMIVLISEVVALAYLGYLFWEY